MLRTNLWRSYELRTISSVTKEGREARLGAECLEPQVEAKWRPVVARLAAGLAGKALALLCGGEANNQQRKVVLEVPVPPHSVAVPKVRCSGEILPACSTRHLATAEVGFSGSQRVRALDQLQLVSGMFCPLCFELFDLLQAAHSKRKANPPPHEKLTRSLVVFI